MSDFIMQKLYHRQYKLEMHSSKHFICYLSSILLICYHYIITQDILKYFLITWTYIFNLSTVNLINQTKKMSIRS